MRDSKKELLIFVCHEVLSAIAFSPFQIPTWLWFPSPIGTQLSCSLLHTFDISSHSFLLLTSDLSPFPATQVSPSRTFKSYQKLLTEKGYFFFAFSSLSSSASNFSLVSLNSFDMSCTSTRSNALEKE